jgi:hypothetical protein
MRNLIVLVTLLFSVSAIAEQTPKYLEGATVTVTLKNGKTYEYKSEEYAVVPRQNLNINAAKVAGFDTLHKKVVNKELVKNKKNRVFGLVGKGPTGGLDVSTNGKRYETEHEEGAVMGVGYQRKVNDDFNLGLVIQNNKTTSFSLGLDF